MHRVLTIALALLVSHAALAENEPPPNIVLVLADDMGYGDVSSYNPNSKIKTPNIDRLASEGVRFTDAHAGGSSCIPSRYALMTGRFAVRASMSLAQGPLIDSDRMTLASLLRKHGYQTAMVGKWHLGFTPFLQDKKNPVDYSLPLRGGPVDRGFDSFFGMHASLDLPPYFYIRDRQPVRKTDGPDRSGFQRGRTGRLEQHPGSLLARGTNCAGSQVGSGDSSLL